MIAVEPIGYVRGGREEVSDDYWGGTRSRIELDSDKFSPESLHGLDEFSHVVVVFHFDRIDPATIVTGLRHPRENPHWPKVGVFAHRGKARPNRLGVSVCEIVSISGLTVEVRGLDAIDGTPVLDLKPYVEEFNPTGPIREPQWIRELMANYYSEQK